MSENDNATTVTLDDIEANISQLDQDEAGGDNDDVAENNESASTNDEKAQAIEALKGDIATLREENQRLISAVDRMVRMYGARIEAQSAQGVEAFPQDPMKVEPSFNDDLADIPALDQIKLS